MENKIKINKPDDELNKELFKTTDDSFNNLSMFIEPPYQNTRSQREIDQELYKKVLKKSIKSQEKKKKKKILKQDQNRGVKSTFNNSNLHDSVTWDSQFDIGYNKKV